MRLTVLGSGAACAGQGGNSSGYLVEDQDLRILLDCGHGVASALVEAMPSAQIDHIFISHMHADHFIDLLPLRFAVTRAMEGLSEPAGCLHLPPGGKSSIAKLLDAVCFPQDFFECVWQVCEFQADQKLELAPGVRVQFAAGVHYIPAWAIRLDGSSSLTFTGDTAPSDEVCRLAMNSDLLLAEATLDEPEQGPVRGHLTPAQAAELARAAAVRRLMLTHFWHDADRQAAARTARSLLECDVLLAEDGAVFEL